MAVIRNKMGISKDASIVGHISDTGVYIIEAMILRRGEDKILYKFIVADDVPELKIAGSQPVETINCEFGLVKTSPVATDAIMTNRDGVVVKTIDLLSDWWQEL